LIAKKRMKREGGRIYGGGVRRNQGLFSDFLCENVRKREEAETTDASPFKSIIIQQLGVGGFLILYLFFTLATPTHLKFQ